MKRLTEKVRKRAIRKNRVRSTITGTSERPRMSVFISNLHISAQIVNDEMHSTLVHVTTVGQQAVKGSMKEKAEWIGTEIAKKAKAAKIKRVVLDRNGRIYHGRVQVLAEAARKEGLEF